MTIIIADSSSLINMWHAGGAALLDAFRRPFSTGIVQGRLHTSCTAQKWRILPH
jgi:hypothetical protein